MTFARARRRAPSGSNRRLFAAGRHLRPPGPALRELSFQSIRSTRLCSPRFECTPRNGWVYKFPADGNEACLQDFSLPETMQEAFFNDFRFRRMVQAGVFNEIAFQKMIQLVFFHHSLFRIMTH